MVRRGGGVRVLPRGCEDGGLYKVGSFRGCTGQSPGRSARSRRGFARADRLTVESSLGPGGAGESAGEYLDIDLKSMAVMLEARAKIPGCNRLESF